MSADFSKTHRRREEYLPIPRSLTNSAGHESPIGGGNLTIPRARPKRRRMDNPQRALLLCVNQLIAGQLPHGGWPFHSGATQAGVEPRHWRFLRCLRTCFGNGIAPFVSCSKSKIRTEAGPPFPKTARRDPVLRAWSHTHSTVPA